MNMLELILFRVGHGLSVALIEHPENYIVVIDLGAEVGFTPLKFLLLKRKLRANILYITHPHGDHIADIETALDPYFSPLAVYCQQYNWDDVATREKPELRYRVKSLREFLGTVPNSSYRGRASLNPWYYTPNQARQIFGEDRYINASSLLVVYKWRDFKIAIAGDQESAVMNAFLNSNGFTSDAKKTDILVAPHHGHRNGFPVAWTTVIGKPWVTLVSVQERDPNVDGRYSTADFARGVNIAGKIRYALTTRADGNIFVKMWYNEQNKPVWNFELQGSL